MTGGQFQGNTEQKTIEEVYHAIKSGSKEDCERLIKKINEEYPNSYILQYYAGMAAKKVYDYITAEKCFKRSMLVHTFFSLPVLELAQFYLSISRVAEAEKMLMAIFDKRTLDPMSLTGEMVYNVMENLKICAMLGPEYLKSKDLVQYKKVIGLYGKMITRFKGRGLLTYVDLEGWKNLCLGLGNVYMLDEPEKAHEYYALGLQPGYSALIMDKDYEKLLAKSSLEKSMLLKLNKSLFQGLSVSAGYVLEPLEWMRAKWGSRLYPVTGSGEGSGKKWSGGKIRVGFIGPDFNKNAAGLFLTPVLRDYDPEKLEVYCYYNNASSDQFTEVLRSYPIAAWVNVSNMTDSEVCRIMKEVHGLDVLVDCIGCGVGNRLELLGMRPAEKVVSYVGFPDYSYVPGVTHRISDRWCERVEWAQLGDGALGEKREKVVRLRGCFSCYALFDNVVLPRVKVGEESEAGGSKVVKVGLLQKLSKWHPVVRKAWKEIFEKRPDFVLYVKEEGDAVATKRQKEMVKEIVADESRVKYIPFAAKLEGYLEGIKELDFCLETYPYSGTTTTCSCLLMGVPVFTVEMGKRHVSCVTAGILREMGPEMERYVCGGMEELVGRVCEWGRGSGSGVRDREKIRKRFLEVMDGVDYMERFYEGIREVLGDETGVGKRIELDKKEKFVATNYEAERVKIEVVEVESDEEVVKPIVNRQPTASPACLGPSRGVSSLLVQGWFDVPHSYAIVALQQVACLVEAGVKVYLQKVPYNNPDWIGVGLEEIVGDKVRGLVEKATVWKGEAVDAVLRIACNHEPMEDSLLEGVPTFWFYTAETQRSYDDHLEEFVRYCKLGRIVPITPSAWSAKTFGALGIKSVVVKHGVDPELFNEKRERRAVVRRELVGGGTGGCVFLHVGAMTGNKNVGGVLKGFYDLVVGGADCYLILKGLGDLYRSRELVRDCLEKKMASGAIDRKVWEEKVKGRVKATYKRMTARDVADLYKACDVYVSPYMAEGFNMPVLEALSCGLDVVVSGGGPVTEWGIPEGRVVWLEGYEDMNERGIVFTVTDEAVSEGMLKGYERWKGVNGAVKSGFGFTWQEVTGELLEVMEEFVCSYKYRVGLISGEVIGQRLVQQREQRSCCEEGVPYTLVKGVDKVDGSIAIVKGDHALAFLQKVLPRLEEKVVMVVHNSDENIDRERYEQLLEQDQLLCCFAQNVEFSHPKLVGLPIGMANSGWEHGNMRAMAKVRSEEVSKRGLCYVGFDVRTNVGVREDCQRVLAGRFGWQDQQRFGSYEEYLRYLKGFRYCVCPEGNGADTHRFWECLYLGVVPIVLRGSAVVRECWGKKVRALEVDGWEDVTEELLGRGWKGEVVPPELLELDYYCDWIWHRATVTGVVVLVHLGREVPDYMQYCVESCLKVGMEEVYVYLDEAEVPEWLDELEDGGRVKVVRPEDLGEEADSYKQFLETHPFCLDKEVQGFREGFWQKCLERFFVLYEVIKKYGLTDVVHLENDCLLFQEVWEMLRELRKKEVWSVFMNERRCVPGFFYVRDGESMKRVCEFLAGCGKNDMDGLGDYAMQYPERVGRLPRLGSEMVGWPCIFDAAPLGQFLGGPDPRNGDGGAGFINRDADYRVDGWKVCYRDERWWVSGGTGAGDGSGEVKVGMLHVHGKDLGRFFRGEVVIEEEEVSGRFELEDL
jgi:glycosyltransferase involved in cell wall biosynthesis